VCGFTVIIKIGTLYSPRNCSSGQHEFFGLASATTVHVSDSGRFTNMSALLFISAVLTFLIGIVSEQISALHYKDIEQTDRKGT